MNFPGTGWKNKVGTSERGCNCGTWKNHWLKFTNKSWPLICQVHNCTNYATVGAHIINAGVSGEQIVPMCDSCNQMASTFDLKATTVVKANVSETCGNLR